MSPSSFVVEPSCYFIDSCLPPPICGLDAEINNNLLSCPVLTCVSVLVQEGPGKRRKFEKTRVEPERWIDANVWSNGFLLNLWVVGGRQFKTPGVSCVVIRYEQCARRY